MPTGRVLTVLAGVVVLAALVVAGFRPGGSPADDRTGDPAPSPAGTHTSEPDREPTLPGITGPDSEGEQAQEEPDSGLLVVWARGGLPADAAGTAAALADIAAVTQLRSEVVGLVGSRDADGTVVDAPPDGFRIPVTVVAVDPEAHREFVRDAAAEALRALAPGRVLLSETSADLRGLGVGSHLDIEGAADLEVVGVVPDRVVRGAEVLLHHDDADAVGVPPGGALFVAHRATDDGLADLIAGLEALIPDDTIGRVVDGDVTTRVALVLPMSEVKRRFGEFAYRPRGGERAVDIDPAWVEQHMVDARVPLLGSVRCHEAIIDDLRAALGDIEEAGHGDWIDPRAYGGCFLARHISTERDRLSRHSWGIAIDINVDQSLPGLGPVPPDGIIESFARHGFRWGGDFATPDNHHWEWVGDAATTRPTPP